LVDEVILLPFGGMKLKAQKAAESKYMWLYMCLCSTKITKGGRSIGPLVLAMATTIALVRIPVIWTSLHCISCIRLCIKKMSLSILKCLCILILLLLSLF